MLRHIRRLAVLVGVAVTGLVTLPAASAQETVTVSQQIDKVFERFSGNPPGCAVGVSQGGKVLYTQAYGLANLEYAVRNKADSIFESGSVAKQFTAGAVALLVQDGKLALGGDAR